MDAGICPASNRKFKRLQWWRRDHTRRESWNSISFNYLQIGLISLVKSLNAWTSLLELRNEFLLVNSKKFLVISLRPPAMASKKPCSRGDEKAAHTIPSSENAFGSTSGPTSTPPSPMPGHQGKPRCLFCFSVLFDKFSLNPLDGFWLMMTNIIRPFNLECRKQFLRILTKTIRLLNFEHWKKFLCSLTKRGVNP